jgi:hypothetical protein
MVNLPHQNDTLRSRHRSCQPPQRLSHRSAIYGERRLRASAAFPAPEGAGCAESGPTVKESPAAATAGLPKRKAVRYAKESLHVRTLFAQVAGTQRPAARCRSLSWRPVLPFPQKDQPADQGQAPVERSGPRFYTTTQAVPLGQPYRASSVPPLATSTQRCSRSMWQALADDFYATPNAPQLADR